MNMETDGMETAIDNLEAIRSFWSQQATQHKLSHEASWSDLPVIEMEIREITGLLHDGDQVLDVGCANGFSTLAFATNKQISIRGLDYLPEMIDQAQAQLATRADQVEDRVSFAVGDITDIPEPDHRYDKVIVIRVCINLADWNRQAKALAEVTRVLKPGGLLLLSEATLQGWQQLNSFRNEWGLSDIPMPSFNLYLDESKVVQEVEESLELVEIRNFASSYYVGTRVFKPLLAKALANESRVADPLMHWNRWFSELPAAGEYGTQKLFVFRKRG